MVISPRYWQWAGLLALSLVLSWAFDLASLPAALLLGPMIAGICFGMGGATIRMPRWTATAGQSVIACLVAQTVTLSILTTIAQDWLPIMLLVLSTVLSGSFVGWMLMRFGSLPGATAAWGSTPGSAVAMIAMSTVYGADPRLVALMQYLRMVTVVMTVSLVARLVVGPGHGIVAPGAANTAMSLWPNLAVLETIGLAAAGILVGRYSRIPSAAFFMPMLLAITVHLSGLFEITLPHWLLGITYGGIGWFVGLGFDRRTVMHAARLLPQLIFGNIVLMGLCGLAAWSLASIMHADGMTAYLATNPGGLDSVAIIAIGTKVNVPFVLAVQTLRSFVVTFTGPVLAKLIIWSVTGKPAERA